MAFDIEAHEALVERCKEAEFYETDPWAVEKILENELLTRLVLDPCAGRGVLGRALRLAHYKVREVDLNEWPNQPPWIQPGVDFLKAPREELLPPVWSGYDFSVVMNPPFSLAVEFVERAQALGARKILMFQRLAFLESAGRRDFYDANPPARVWVCGSRATCWRGDTPEYDIRGEGGEVIVKGKKGRSASTPHAWFVWERGHRGAMVTQSIYRDE